MGGQVGLQPALLRRTGRAPVRGAAPRELIALRVERDQVPATDVEAVVALVALPRRAVVHALTVEVVEVAPGIGRRVLVVADGRPDDRLDAAPCLVEHGVEVRQGADVVLSVAQRQHRGEAACHEQIGRRALAAVSRDAGSAVVELAGGVAGDVAGSRDHRVGKRRACGEEQARDRDRKSREQPVSRLPHVHPFAHP